ncbi:hypothetical protein V8B97DRAFT_1936215 [Scleroderma yunnanense]
MPHPSNPIDDIRAHSFDREHGLAFGGISRTFGFVFAMLLAASVNQNQRVECLSDGFLFILCVLAVSVII